jgi:hypothetical protein
MRYSINYIKHNYYVDQLSGLFDDVKCISQYSNTILGHATYKHVFNYFISSRPRRFGYGYSHTNII